MSTANPTMQPVLEQMYNKERPLVFAHRGAMAYAPMNTMAAFELAVEQGADGIELDVWMCMDDIPVVIHDFTVDKTTDGEGRIGSMTLDEIKALDAGSWFSEDFAGQRIPTLDEVFEAVGQQVFINVEVKSTNINNENIVYHVLESIRNNNMSDRVIVSSFNPFVLRPMYKAASDIALGLLQDATIPWYVPLLLMGNNYAAEHPYYKQVDEAFMAKAARKNRHVNVWTVNDPDEARRLKSLGVSSVITDKPDVMLDIMTGE
ncbi:MAG: glycerophosphodiester phosphodiesterase family protein [Chloroflexota bacterium]